MELVLVQRAITVEVEEPIRELHHALEVLTRKLAQAVDKLAEADLPRIIEVKDAHQAVGVGVAPEAERPAEAVVVQLPLGVGHALVVDVIHLLGELAVDARVAH